jgi:hypothetical protein
MPWTTILLYPPTSSNTIYHLSKRTMLNSLNYLTPSPPYSLHKQIVFQLTQEIFLIFSLCPKNNIQKRFNKKDNTWESFEGKKKCRQAERSVYSLGALVMVFLFTVFYFLLYYTFVILWGLKLERQGIREKDRRCKKIFSNTKRKGIRFWRHCILR